MEARSTDPVQAFVVQARRYLALVEDLERAELVGFVEALRQVLPALYAAAAAVPLAESEGADDDADADAEADDEDEDAILEEHERWSAGWRAWLEAHEAEAWRRSGRSPYEEPVRFDFEGEMTHWQWAALFGALHRKLGERDGPVASTLSDDLADIYRDLRQALLAIDRAPTPGDARWAVRSDFDTHWGDHLTNALRVIQRLAGQLAEGADDL